MSKYLLDANCFYSVKNNQAKREQLCLIKNDIIRVPLTILEIAKVDKKKNYDKRKDAMKAFNEIDSKLLQETPDDLVARAFGQAELQGPEGRLTGKTL